MPDPAHVRYVVEHYPQLQGLRLVPLGLVFLATAAWRAGHLGWLPGTSNGGIRLWFLAALGLAIALSYMASAYYRRLFGELSLAPYRSGGPRLLAFGSAVFLSLVLQDALRLPFSLPLLVVGILTAYVGLNGGGLRQHYLVIAVACGLVASPLGGSLLMRTHPFTRDLLLAGGLLVAGIGDHLVLQRILRAPGRRAYVDTAV